MRLPKATALRRLLEWDRDPGKGLAMRAGIVLLAFRPWAFSFEPVAFPASDLDPALLAAARTAGINLLGPEGWPSHWGTVAWILLAALGFSLLWWCLSRVRRLVMGRFGPGLLAFLGLAGGYLVLQVWGIALLARGFPETHPMATAVAVWGGWLRHPLLAGGGFQMTLSALAMLGALVGEGLLMAAEGHRLLEEAQEGALRSRLSPHFLFNTLNTLAAQIEEDPQEALETTQRLGGLFEQVLQVTKRPTLPLHEELTMVEAYLGLERKRLGDRLRVEVKVPEELLERHIPVLSLQVLVENALKHAVAPRLEGGSLKIGAREEGRGLRILVEDSGDGVSLARTGTGQALDNLRARLHRPGDLRQRATPGGHETSFWWA